MRKHKSVVAILLAVMMIFTFMPTMSFAATGDATWSPDYKTVTFEGYAGTYNATWTEKSDGVTEASATTTDGQYSDAIYFIDLSDAKITTPAIASGQNMSIDAYNALLGSDAVVTVTAKNAKGNGDVTAWNTTLSGEKVEKTITTNVKMTLTVAFKAKGTTVMDGSTPEKAVLVNAPLTIDVNVVPDVAPTDTPDQDSVFIGKDEYDIYAGEVHVPYTGSTQTLTIKDATNYTEGYEKYSSTTGKWSAVDAIEVKDVADYDTFRGVYTPKTGDPTYTDEFTVVVDPACGVGFGFDKDGNAGDYEYNVDEGVMYDPADFVTAEAGYWDYNYSQRYHVFTIDEWVVGTAKSDKAAVAANEAELKNYFKERFGIERSSTKAKPLDVNLSIVDKYDEMTEDEQKAFDKKYEQLEANFAGIIRTESYNAGSYWNPVTRYVSQQIGGIALRADTTAKVHLIPATPVVNDKDDDITFTGVTTKSYKAKKKTKKLAKAKSFQVAATAASGNAVTFTATSSNAKVSIDATGKVTVKKGLKKGAKVKLVVKARTEAGNGYKAVSAEKTYTIKIK